MEIAIAEEVQTQADDHAGNVRAGVVLRKWLLSGEAKDGLRFRFFRSKYQDGDDAFQSPRHHHGFQQIRWTESGSINFAPGQDIAEGDIAYFPRGAFYGPQVKDSGIGLLLQFGFGAELPRSKYEMHREMHASGEGEEGAEKDATSKPVIPVEGYDGTILMHPRAYTYFDLAPGVGIKHLGDFYDHSCPNADVRISMIQLSEGGTHRLGAERAQLVWSIAPGLQIEGRIYPELTCLYSPRDEQVALTGFNDVEAYIVEFPRLD
jgi:hypothetical protein